MTKANTKFFKVVTNDNTNDEYYSLYVCHKDTPIPTAKEIVERNQLNPHCENDKVIEISMETFLALHAKLLAFIADSAEDMIEWSPNLGNICTWEYWANEEEM